MRKRKGRSFYWLVLALVLALAVVYVERRELQERYGLHRQRGLEVEAARRQVEELANSVEADRLQVQGLDRDPLEVEAAIRSDRLVRPGEHVYEIMETQAAGDAAAP